VSQELQDSIDVLQEQIRWCETKLKSKFTGEETPVALRIKKKIESHKKAVEILKQNNQ
jgi:hypothetical protein